MPYLAARSFVPISIITNSGLKFLCPRVPTNMYLSETLMYVSIYFNPVGINIIYHKRTSPNKYYTLFRLCCSNGLELLKAIIVNSSELWKLWSTSIENGTNSLQNKYISVRGHPKMSTFSWVYKQYTFSDPLLPPPFQVYRIIFLVSKIWVYA